MALLKTPKSRLRLYLKKSWEDQKNSLRIVILTLLVLFLIGKATDLVAEEQLSQSVVRGLIGDGSRDETALIQAALAKAAEKGGKVFLPPGRYRVDGSLTIPAGVSLEGVLEFPVDVEPLKGTVIMAYGGRGAENGPALFEMGSSCAVRGLTVYYPEQKASDIKPYAWTFHLKGFDHTVENVTLVNSYNGIRVGPEANGRHRLRSISGCVLRRGISIDHCVDIGRIENVHFHSIFWKSENLGGHRNIVFKFMEQNLEAFIFARTDWEFVNNTFVFPANTGYHFVSSATGAANGQFSGIAADSTRRPIVVEALQSMGLLISNGQFVAMKGPSPTALVVEPSCTGSIRLVNCTFWGPMSQVVQSRGSGFLSLSDCYFQVDFNERSHPQIEIAAGRFQLRGCSFKSDGTSVLLKPGVQHAIVTENNGVNGVRIVNEIGERAILANNEPDRMPAQWPAKEAVPSPATQAKLFPVAVVLGAQQHEQGLALLPGSKTEGFNEPVLRSGREAWATVSEVETHRMYFVVKNEAFRNGKSPMVEVVFDYFDEGSGVVIMQYDSLEDSRSGAFKELIPIVLRDSGKWKTARVILKDARFAGRCNGNDFRLSVSGENNLAMAAVGIRPWLPK